MSRTRHARAKVEKILIYRRMNSVPRIIRQTHYIVWYRATTQTGKFLWRLQAIQFQEEVLSQAPNLLFFPATRQLESKRCTQTATIAQHLRGLLRLSLWEYLQAYRLETYAPKANTETTYRQK